MTNRGTPQQYLDWSDKLLQVICLFSSKSHGYSSETADCLKALVLKNDSLRITRCFSRSLLSISA